MSSSLLAGCRGFTIRKRHIEDNHFGKVPPTNSYFLVTIQALLAFVNKVLTGEVYPVITRRTGEQKLILVVDYGSIVGYYRKGQATTNYFSIVLKRSTTGWVYVQTAYPDNLTY